MWWSSLIFVAAIWSKAYAVPIGENTCQGVVKHPVTVRVNVTEPVTFRTYTWCLRVPPRCSKYVVQMKERIKVQTEMHNRTITVCCRGYVEMDQRCVPACPPHTECPHMHCNRTNHCHCTPGYTGVFCNDACPKGVWGKDCKKPCDCPPGFTCHHLTGDCMLDDSPGGKTTVRRAFTDSVAVDVSPSKITHAPSTRPATNRRQFAYVKTTPYPTVKLPKRFTESPHVWMATLDSTTRPTATVAITRPTTIATTRQTTTEATTRSTTTEATSRPTTTEATTRPTTTEATRPTTTEATRPTTTEATTKAATTRPTATEVMTTISTTTEATTTTRPTTTETTPTTRTTTTRPTTTVTITTRPTTTEATTRRSIIVKEIITEPNVPEKIKPLIETTIPNTLHTYRTPMKPTAIEETIKPITIPMSPTTKDWQQIDSIFRHPKKEFHHPSVWSNGATPEDLVTSVPSSTTPVTPHLQFLTMGVSNDKQSKKQFEYPSVWTNNDSPENLVTSTTPVTPHLQFLTMRASNGKNKKKQFEYPSVWSNEATPEDLVTSGTPSTTHVTPHLRFLNMWANNERPPEKKADYPSVWSNNDSPEDLITSVTPSTSETPHLHRFTSGPQFKRYPGHLMNIDYSPATEKSEVGISETVTSKQPMVKFQQFSPMKAETPFMTITSPTLKIASSNSPATALDKPILPTDVFKKQETAIENPSGDKRDGLSPFNNIPFVVTSEGPKQIQNEKILSPTPRMHMERIPSIEGETFQNTKIKKDPFESSVFNEPKENHMNSKLPTTQSPVQFKETPKTFPPMLKKPHKNSFSDFNIEGETSPEEATEEDEDEDEDEPEDPDESYSDYDTFTTVLTTTPRPFAKFPIYVSGVETEVDIRSQITTPKKLDILTTVPPLKVPLNPKVTPERVTILKPYFGGNSEDVVTKKYNPLVLENAATIQPNTKFPASNVVLSSGSSKQFFPKASSPMDFVTKKTFDWTTKKVIPSNAGSNFDIPEKEIKKISIISPSVNYGGGETPPTPKTPLPASNIVWIFNSTTPHQYDTRKVKQVTNWTNNEFSNFLPTLQEINSLNETFTKRNSSSVKSIPSPSNPLPSGDDFLNLTFILNSINDFTSNNQRVQGKDSERVQVFNNMAVPDGQMTSTVSTTEKIKDSFYNVPQNKVKTNRKYKDSTQIPGANSMLSEMNQRPESDKELNIEERLRNSKDPFSSKEESVQVTTEKLYLIPSTLSTLRKHVKEIDAVERLSSGKSVESSQETRVTQDIQSEERNWQPQIRNEKLTTESVSILKTQATTAHSFYLAQLNEENINDRTKPSRKLTPDYKSPPSSNVEASYVEALPKSLDRETRVKNDTSSFPGTLEKKLPSTSEQPEEAAVRRVEVNKKPFRRKDDDSSETSYNMSEPLASRSRDVESTPWVTGILVSVGCTLLTGIVASCVVVLMIYCKRSSDVPVPMEPCIMAYQATPAEPHVLYSVPRPSISPDVFFCPTFSNVYAEQINRELREMSYEKAKTTPSEPLYAEISN